MQSTVKENIFYHQFVSIHPKNYDFLQTKIRHSSKSYCVCVPFSQNIHKFVEKSITNNYEWKKNLIESQLPQYNWERESEKKIYIDVNTLNLPWNAPIQIPSNRKIALNFFFLSSCTRMRCRCAILLCYPIPNFFKPRRSNNAREFDFFLAVFFFWLTAFARYVIHKKSKLFFLCSLYSRALSACTHRHTP